MTYTITTTEYESYTMTTTEYDLYTMTTTEYDLYTITTTEYDLYTIIHHQYKCNPATLAVEFQKMGKNGGKSPFFRIYNIFQKF